MKIFFTKYAKQKFDILQDHKYNLSKEQVVHVVEIPDVLDTSAYPLHIAQRKISSLDILKVVYKKEAGIIKVITFYPVQYDKKI